MNASLCENDCKFMTMLCYFKDFENVQDAYFYYMDEQGISMEKGYRKTLIRQKCRANKPMKQKTLIRQKCRENKPMKQENTYTTEV